MPLKREFRVKCLDLSLFFYDHRRTARIFVEKSLKTIKDLQDRITSIFNIEGFCLLAGGHYLPSSQDICVLEKDDLICVIPMKPTTPTNQIPLVSTNVENIQQKRTFADEPLEKSSPIKKKSKNSNEDSVRPKSLKNKIKKSKTDSIETKDSDDNSFSKSVPSSTSKQSSVEENSKIEPTNLITATKEQYKRKTDEYIQQHSLNNNDYSFKSVLPKIQNHLKNCKDLRTDVSDRVRLSRLPDTPHQKFSQYVAPKLITDQYLVKNKVNVVKIDVIKQSDNANGEVVHNGTSKEESSVNLNAKNTICSEKNGGIELKNENKQEIQTEASDYTKLNLDEAKQVIDSTNLITIDDAKLLITLPENQTINNGKSVDTSGFCTAMEDYSNTTPTFVTPTTGLKTVKHKNVSCSDTLDLSTQSLPANLERDITKQNSIETSMGALMERLRESDSVISQESDSSFNNITKRKRIRKRKRQNKYVEETVETDSQIVKEINYPTSRQNKHIKFKDEEDNSPAIDLTHTLYVANSDLSNTEILNSAGDKESSQFNSNILSESNLSAAVFMKDKVVPRKGDIIAFKILKMDDNYVPGLSNYITGRVSEYREDKTVSLKILKGKEELSAPRGVFSLEEENEVVPENMELQWDEMLEAKLLFP